MNSKKIVLIVVGLAFLVAGGLWLLVKQQPVSREREITLRTESFALNLYPPLLAEINSRSISTLLHAPLIRMGGDGQLTPEVASEWSDDGLTWRFTIRPGAKFSDGSKLTAEDAAASICRTMQPGTSWAWSLGSIAQSADGDKVECDGVTFAGNELVIRQTYDAPWLAEALSGPAGWIIPKTVNAEASYGVVPGAGRYKVEQIVPDSFVLLSPVDSESGLASVRFRYVADDNQAAALMKNEKLSVLYLQSPLLKMAVKSSKGQNFELKSRAFDRVRILVINEASLRKKGFSEQQIKTFRDALDTKIDRDRLEEISDGIAIADSHPLPVFGQLVRSSPSLLDIESLPDVKLTVFSEPDAFSDQIAATLPKSVGPVKLAYRGMDKGSFIGALVGGDFDIACVILEATMHSPKFWASFFEPNGAFVAFGKPINGTESIDFTKAEAVYQLDALLQRDSNWIQLFRENRVDAIGNSITGLMFSPSGQVDFGAVKLDTAADR
ncbi:ABC transporter substrate-binding protein [Parasphingorhabdus sp.]|uniref:ABC transporter substrate-binding protein n=1 Tax=Parasphingorhabdus sp. TaxID=2709688 RepID=UPI0035931A43